MEENEATEVFIHDSFDTPTILVDGIHGMQFRDGMIQFNFTLSQFAVPGSEVEGQFLSSVTRVVMPLTAFYRISDYLKDRKEEMERGGLASSTNPFGQEEK